MRTAVAVAALCAAFCFALGSLIQQGAARQTHARTLRFGLLVALVHERRWLGGVAVTVLAFGIQGVALAFGPLALVQPLVATEVLFALPMVAHRNRRPLMRKGIIGGLGVASGMAIFVAVSPSAGGVSVPGLSAWAPALAGITALAALSAFVALRASGIARVIWLAAATAVIYTFVNAVTKSGVDLLMFRGAGVLTTWEPYALMAVGILSGLFGQSAFNAGPLSLSLPVIDTVEPVSSVSLPEPCSTSIWRGHRGCLRSSWLAARSRRPGSLFSATLPSCWRRNAANPGRSALRSARLPQVNGAAERRAVFPASGFFRPAQ